MSFTAEFDNNEVTAFVKNLDKNLKSIKDGKKEYVGLISANVYADVIDHFKNEEGSGGGWKPWSNSYSSFMDSIGKGGNKILQDSGKLRNNFAPTKWKSTSGGVYWYNNAKTKSGFSYAYAHDEGGNKLPKRDFMWLSDKALDKVANQTLQFMMEKGI